MPKPSFPTKIFLHRLKKLQDEHGLQDPHDLNAYIGIPNWFNRFKNRCEIETILAIANTFGVSVDWLLGRQPQKQILAQEHVDTSYMARPDLKIDTRSQIKILLDDYLDKTRQSLSSKGRAIMESMLEEYYLENFEMPDERIIEAYMPWGRKENLP